MTESNASDPAEDGDGTSDDGLPRDVVDEVERLTRLERGAVDENESEAYEQRRDELLDDHDFTARVRDDDGDDILVCHPEEWHDEENGVIRTERIDNIDRAVEIALEGTADPDDWAAVDEHNRDLVAAVKEAHGDVHGDNAAMLADFAGNHYAKPMESLTSEELAEFGTDYVVRNAWPSAKQQEVIAESIELVFETAEEPVPEIRF
ncbi:DUF7108 family protein [Natrinema versiforme]|uniref:RnhA operon protein n=1 Tax=Natrinema versiforme JCM 10478 TaxID=1227496 RepID=L9XSA9_9EURY|nr:hypothetical protein [Natrinema versiforme]ELY64427.1 hypothetical protein C489_16779 [Natrinema versiforme JCM 10478]